MNPQIRVRRHARSLFIRARDRFARFPRSFSSIARAFTLIEVLMGLSILTVGILGILWLYPWTLRANQDAELRTAAGGLAMMKVEEIRRDDTATTSTSLLSSILALDDPTTAAIWPLDRRLAYSFASDVLVVTSGTSTTEQSVAKVIVYRAASLDDDPTTLTELLFQ